MLANLFNFQKIGNINFFKKNWKLILQNYFMIYNFAKLILKNSKTEFCNFLKIISLYEFCNFFLYFANKIEIYFAKIFVKFEFNKFCKFNFQKIGNINFCKKNWKLILQNYFMIQNFVKLKCSVLWNFPTFQFILQLIRYFIFLKNKH